MNSNLLIGLLVAMFVCCAQAGVEKFGDLGTGEEGFYKRCFTKMSLGNLATAYLEQKVGQLLARDIHEIDAEIDGQFSQFGTAKKGCSSGCYKLYLRQESASVQPGEKEVDETRCKRQAMFKRQCELARSRGSTDARFEAITKWLCETSVRLTDQMHEGYVKCQDDPKHPKVYRSMAEKSFDIVASSSLEDLEKAKEKAAIAFAESDRQRKALDDIYTAEAYSKVNKGIELLPQYIKCSKRQVMDEAREAEEMARRKVQDELQWEESRAQADRDDQAKKEHDDMVNAGLIAFALLNGGR